jgi:hypothetical protein
MDDGVAGAARRVLAARRLWGEVAVGHSCASAGWAAAHGGCTHHCERRQCERRQSGVERPVCQAGAPVLWGACQVWKDRELQAGTPVNCRLVPALVHPCYAEAST